MAGDTVTIPRARFEAMVRQTLAMREQLDALSLMLQSEMTPVDPREKTATPPATFGRRSA